MVKKIIKGQNHFKRENIPAVKNKPSTKVHKDPVERLSPTQALNERRAVKGNAARLAYAKKQRKRMGK